METSQKDECQFLVSTISRISAEIDTLSTKQAKLNRRLNDLRSHTSILPPETLTTIFEYVCSEQREKYILASVCSHWHHVVHNSPSLWTSVVLRIRRRGNNLDNLLYHHKKAKGIPLSVDVRFRNLTQKETGPSNLLFPTLFRDVAHDLRSLTFQSINSHLWSVIETYAGADSGFSKLENLTLSFSQVDTVQMAKTTPLFPGSPLRSVTLNSALVGIEKRLPLDRIETISGWGASAEHGMQVLLRSLTAVTFKWGVHSTRSLAPDVETSMLNSPVVFPFLETMVWKGGSVTSVATVVQQLQFPVLRTLDWSEHSLLRESDEDSNSGRSFFSAMPQLRMLNVDFNADLKDTLLPWVPSVEALKVTCHGPEAGMVDFLLRRMTLTGIGPLLPRLKSMTLLLKTTAPSELNALIHMLESRRTPSITQCVRLEEFTLRIKLHGITEVWQEHHIDAFRWLEERGLKLEIWEDNYEPGRLVSLQALATQSTGDSHVSDLD